MPDRKPDEPRRIDALNIAAVWPVSAHLTPAPLPEAEMSSQPISQRTSAAQDVSAVANGKLASRAAMIAASFFAKARAAYSTLARRRHS